jgi:non-heme chloroperoxidase
MRSHKNVLSIRNGLELEYYEIGDPAGPPVIFLHGVTDSLRSFDRIAPLLDDPIRGVFITQRGHGDSSRPESGYDPVTMAEDVTRVMDKLDIRTAAIVGHSMGSFVAQKVAIDAPERVRGLVLIGSFATCSTNQGVKDFVDSVVDGLSDPIPREFFEEFQAGSIEIDVPDDFMEAMVNESSKVPISVMKQAMKCMIDTDHTADLARIECPVLLLWGDRDAYFSLDDQQVLLSNIPDARLVTHPGVGHSPNWEVPELVADQIRKFLDDLDRVDLRAAA